MLRRRLSCKRGDAEEGVSRERDDAEEGVESVLKRKSMA
jgi:hypothetical protein